MSTTPPEPPRSTIYSVGKVAEDVAAGLKGSPFMLALLALNAIGIGAAVWFLGRLIEASDARMALILKACLPHAQ